MNLPSVFQRIPPFQPLKPKKIPVRGVQRRLGSKKLRQFRKMEKSFADLIWVKAEREPLNLTSFFKRLKFAS